MRLYIPLILLVGLTVMLIGQITYESDLENNKTRDIYNFTESTLVWNFTQDIELYDGTYSDVGRLRTNRIGNVINKFVDFIGYSAFESSKGLMEFGYTHPQYDFNFMLKAVMYYLIISIILIAIPVLIPVLVLICLIGIAIYNFVNIIIKYFKSKK